MGNIGGYSDTTTVIGSSLKEGEPTITTVDQIEIFNPEKVVNAINSTSTAVFDCEQSINKVKDDILTIDGVNKELYENVGVLINKLDKNANNINSAKSYVSEIIVANRKELNSMNWFQKIIHFRKVKHLQTYINTLMVVKEALSMLTTHQ